MTLTKTTGVITLNGYGMDTGGALRSVSGTNTVSSALTLGSASGIGVDTGSTLNLSGGLLGAFGLTVNTAGTGQLNFTGAIGSAAVPTGITKIGAGSAALTAASGAWTGTLAVNSGSFALSGAGILGGTGAITVLPGATLSVSDAGTALANRLGGRGLSLSGASFGYTINSTAASAETAGALTLATGGSSFTVTNPASQSSTITFASLTQSAAGSTANFSGALGTANNKIIFTAAPTLTPVTTGILARDTVAGADFATYGANGVVAYSSYNNSGAYTNLNTAAATDTLKVGVGFITSSAVAGSKTVNALSLVGSGLQLTGSACWFPAERIASAAACWSPAAPTSSWCM